MTVHVGFTGTRNGMMFIQHQRLNDLIWRMKCHVFHHGCCVGSDTQAHKIAYDAQCQIHAHPPIGQEWRADLIFRRTDIVDARKPYLERNRDIVDATEVLIATPGEMTEQLRSGTWSTIRHARKRGKRVIIIFPDGTVSDSATDKGKAPPDFSSGASADRP